MALNIKNVAVVGAGTMGSGIARHFVKFGCSVKLFDALPGAASRAMTNISEGFAREAEKGKLPKAEADAAVARLEVVDSLDSIANSDLVMEVIIEQVEAKHNLYHEIERHVGDHCIIATNTSSLAVTRLASALAKPERFLGIHFFNPAHIMPLVEIVAALQSRVGLPDEMREFISATGKTAVIAQDTPGFIVNRVARPFYLEAFRMLEDGCATPDDIDAVMKDGGRFPMGPFELTDFIGQDVNSTVSTVVFEQLLFDRRFTPSLIQNRLAAAGRLGKKTGHGVYKYENDAPVRAPRPKATPDVRTKLRVEHDSDERQHKLRALLGQVADTTGEIELVWAEDDMPEQVSVDGVNCHIFVTDCMSPVECAAGFELDASAVFTLSPMSLLRGGELVVLGQSRASSPEWIRKLESVFAAVPRQVVWTHNAPGHIIPRIVAMLVNVAVDALDKGVADADSIDNALKLGTRYPAGPLEWAEEWGLDRVCRALEALYGYYGDERYYPCPGLRERAVLGIGFRG